MGQERTLSGGNRATGLRPWAQAAKKCEVPGKLRKASWQLLRPPVALK